MAVTLTQLAAELRLGDGSTAPAGPVGDILERILAVSTTLVRRYAPHAIESVQDAAIIRVAAFLYDTDPSGSRNVYPNALVSSGAAALLDMYRGPSGHELGARAQSSPGDGGGGDGDEVVDETAREAAATALERAIDAESDAAQAATAAAVADSKATDAATAASHAATAAASAHTEAQSAAKTASDAQTAAEGAQSTATAAQTAAAGALTAAQGAQSSADDAQQDADQAETDATAAQRTADANSASITALGTRVDGIAARTPTADPPALRAWATDADGNPDWLQEQSGVTVSSHHESDWRPLPDAHGWLWAMLRHGGTQLRLYPTTAVGNRLRSNADRNLLNAYSRLHFGRPTDSVQTTFLRPRSAPGAVVEYHERSITVGADQDGDLFLAFLADVQVQPTSRPVQARSLDLEWRFTRHTDPARAAAVQFDGALVRHEVEDGEAVAHVQSLLAEEAAEAAEDAHVRADSAHALAAAAQAAANRAQMAADEAAAAAAALGGRPLPTSRPPQRSYWGTGDLALEGEWLPTQPLSHVQVLTDQEWGAWGDLANPNGWHFSMHQGNGVMLLTPTSLGSPLQGDTDRVTLLRWVDLHLPWAHVQFRRRGARVGLGGGAQPRYTRIVETDGSGTLAVEIGVDRRLLPDLDADQHNQLPAGLNLQVSLLPHGGSVEAHGIRYEDMQVTGTGPQVTVYAGTREIRTSVSREEARRIAADDGLGQQILTAENNRTTGDQNLGFRVDAEALAREQADAVLEARTPTANPPPSSSWATDDASVADWRRGAISSIGWTGVDLGEVMRLPVSPHWTSWEIEADTTASHRVAFTPHPLSRTDERQRQLIDYMHNVFPKGHSWVGPTADNLVPVVDEYVNRDENAAWITLILDGEPWDPQRVYRDTPDALAAFVQRLDASQTVYAETMSISPATVTGDGDHARIVIDQSTAEDAIARLEKIEPLPLPTADPPPQRVWGTYNGDPSWERGSLLVRQVAVRPWQNLPGSPEPDNQSLVNAFQNWTVFRVAVDDGPIPRGLYAYPQSLYGDYAGQILVPWLADAIGTGAPCYLRRRSAPNEVALVSGEYRQINRSGRNDLGVIRFFPDPYFGADIATGTGLTPAQLDIQIARRDLIQGLSVNRLDVEYHPPLFADLPGHERVATLRAP